MDSVIAVTAVMNSFYQILLLFQTLVNWIALRQLLRCKQKDTIKYGVVAVLKTLTLFVKGAKVKSAYSRQAKSGIKQFNKRLQELEKEYSTLQQSLQSIILSRNMDALAVFQKKQMQLEKSIDSMRRLTVDDFGTQKEFYPLFGKCFSIVSNEKVFKSGSFDAVAKDFEFKLCPFENVTQHEVNGDAETLLGVWQQWHVVNEWRKEMLYSNGDECWNGPQRIVRVILECGLEDKLEDVKEDGKCTYEMTLATPAACSTKYARTLLSIFKQEEQQSQVIFLHSLFSHLI
jgi:hypothetical protein